MANDEALVADYEALVATADHHAATILQVVALVTLVPPGSTEEAESFPLLEAYGLVYHQEVHRYLHLLSRYPLSSTSTRIWRNSPTTMRRCVLSFLTITPISCPILPTSSRRCSYLLRSFSSPPNLQVTQRLSLCWPVA